VRGYTADKTWYVPSFSLSGSLAVREYNMYSVRGINHPKYLMDNDDMKDEMQAEEEKKEESSEGEDTSSEGEAM
jgi:hypothetical protein